MLFSIQLRAVARSSTWQGIVVDVCVTVGGVGRGVEGEGGEWRGREGSGGGGGKEGQGTEPESWPRPLFHYYCVATEELHQIMFRPFYMAFQKLVFGESTLS